MDTLNQIKETLITQSEKTGKQETVSEQGELSPKNYMMWKKPSFKTKEGEEKVTQVDHFPGAFIYSPFITKEVVLGEASLIHATSVDSLIEMLTASDALVLKTNKSNDSNEISSLGVLFCGIDVKFEENEQVPDYAKLNRYGACVIRFRLPDGFFSQEKLAAFKMGTKFYRQEYCQMILVDANNSPRNYYVIDKDAKKEVNCEKIVNPEDYIWTLQYDAVNKNGTYTTAELVFPHEINLSECTDLSIEFDAEHNCVINRKEKCKVCRLHWWKYLQSKGYKFDEKNKENFTARSTLLSDARKKIGFGYITLCIINTDIATKTSNSKT